MKGIGSIPIVGNFNYFFRGMFFIYKLSNLTDRSTALTMLGGAWVNKRFIFGGESYIKELIGDVPEFVRDLKKVLPAPDKFRRMTENQQRLVNSKVQFLTGAGAKDHLLVDSKKVPVWWWSSRLYPKEQAAFVKLMTSEWNKPRNLKLVKRRSMEMRSLCADLIPTYCSYIISQPELISWRKFFIGFIFDGEKAAASVCFNELFEETLRRLYKDFKDVKTTDFEMSKVFEQFVNSKGETSKGCFVTLSNVDDSLDGAWHVVFVRKVVDLLVLRLESFEDSYPEMFREAVSQCVSIAKGNQILDNEHRLKRLSLCVRQVLQERGQLLSDSVLKKSKSKSRKYIFVEKKWAPVNTVLPHLIPSKVNIKSNHITSFGVTKMSGSALEALQYSDNTPFNINNNFCLLLKDLLFNGRVLDSHESKIPTFGTLLFLKKELERLRHSSSVDLVIKRDFSNILSKCNLSSDNPKDVSKIVQAQQILGLQSQDLEKYWEYCFKKIQLKQLELQWSKAFLQLSLAEVFSGFDLFFTTRLDYRGRTYPEQNVFSRTQGIFKYLVCSSKRERLKPLDYVHLFNAFLAGVDGDKALESLVKLLSTHNSMDEDLTNECIRVLDEAALSFQIKRSIKKELYFTLLKLEILEALKTGVSGFLIELDQRSSTPALMAILFGNLELAEATIFTSERNAELVPRLQQSVKVWFDLGGIVLEEGEARQFYDVLVKDKRVMKACFLRFINGQKANGRGETLMSFIKLYSLKEDWVLVYKLANSFDKFVDTQFSSLNLQKRALEGIFRLFIREQGGLKFFLPDGVVIEYCIFDFRSSYKRFKVLPVGEVSGKVFTRHGVFTSTQVDFLPMERSAVPNLMQSIDAYVLRRVLYALGKKGFHVNHTHDSFMVPCSIITEFFSIMDTVYKEEFLKLSIDNLVIIPNSEKLSSGVHHKISSKMRDIQKVGKSISWERFDARNCYKFES